MLARLSKSVRIGFRKETEHNRSRCSIAEQIPKSTKDRTFPFVRASCRGCVLNHAICETRKWQALQQHRPMTLKRRQKEPFTAEEHRFQTSRSLDVVFNALGECD